MNKDYVEFFDVTEDISDWANLKLPDPSLLDYYKRLKNREILINQNIDDGTVEWTNLKLPDPSLLDYYKRLKNREILINQNIDDGTVEWTQEIIQWNREDKDIPVKDRKPIKIFINSNGGSLNSIMELITMCNLSKTPVYAIGMGKCYSAGGLLLMGITKGNRYILNTTEALIHDGSTGTFGDTGKVLDDLEYTRKTEEFTKKFILDHTDIPENEYDKNYRRNWWLDSNEIIEYGVADKIVENIDELF